MTDEFVAGAIEDVDDLVDAFAARFRKRLRQIVREEQRGEDPRWVDQSMSPLGNRVHVAAVKRRLAAVGPDAVTAPGARWDRRKRLYFLNQEAIAEEIGRRSDPGRVKKARPVEEGDDAVAELEAELARVRQ